MKEECGWCGEVKEVHAWQEADVDSDGALTYNFICEDCYKAIFNDDQSSKVTESIEDKK